MNKKFITAFTRVENAGIKQFNELGQEIFLNIIATADDDFLVIGPPVTAVTKISGALAHYLSGNWQ